MPNAPDGWVILIQILQLFSVYPLLVLLSHWVAQVVGAHVVDSHPKKMSPWCSLWCRLMLSVEGGWWCPCQAPGTHPLPCAVGHPCKCSAHLTLLCGFCSLGCCRRGSHHSLQENTDCTWVWGLYHHVNNPQQLILWANIQILASLTCACCSILLCFMLGVAVVMNETVMLGYLLTDNIEKNNQALVTVNYPPTFLVLAILSHFIPHNQKGWLLPTWIWSHLQWLFQDSN